MTAAPQRCRCWIALPQAVWCGCPGNIPCGHPPAHVIKKRLVCLLPKYHKGQHFAGNRNAGEWTRWTSWHERKGLPV